MTKEYFLGDFTIELETLPHFLLWNKEKVSNAPLSEMDLFEIEVALEEVFVNIISYSGLSKTSLLKEDLYISDQLVCCILEDSGKEFNPLKNIPQVDVTQSAENRSLGGLGIFLVNEIMDQLSYERVDNCNRLTLIKYIK